VIGIEWNRILHSPVGREIRGKLLQSDFGKLKPLEMVDQIQRIFISSPGRPESSEQKSAPAVVALQGSFELDKLRGLAKEKLTKALSYQSVEILEHQDADGSATALALVSPQTILLGDGPSVRAALDHYFTANPDQVSNPLFSRAAELAAKSDLWIVAKASPSDFSDNHAEQAQFLNDIEGVEAGISLQDGLGVELNLGTKSAESAQTLAGGLQFMLGMITADQSKGLPDLTRKLFIKTDGAQVHIAFSLDTEEVQAALQKAGPSMLPGLGGTFQKEAEVQAAMNGHTNPVPGSAPLLPAEKKVIRIYGLEEGVREVPFKR
jgi:hypothetical protein